MSVPQDTFLSLTQPEPTTGKYFTVITNVAAPAAFGNVTITSKDAFTSPTINPNLLGTAYDVATMREAIKSSAAIASSNALKSNFILQPYGQLATVLADGSDAAIEAYAQGFTTTVWHPACSTRMTTANGKDGVLNPSLQVIGTAGLRVVDAGSFVCCLEAMLMSMY
jgi:choline dehydrogenase-like flavoprotein